MKVNENKNNPNSDYNTNESGNNIDRERRYDTESFLDDEKYRQDRINSYAHYHEYSENDNSIFNNDYKYENTSHRAEEAQTNTDGVNSEQVRKLVKEEMARGKKKPFGRILSALIFGLIGSVMGIMLYTQALPFFNKNQPVSNTGNGSTAVQINAIDPVNIESAVNEKAGKSVVGISTRIQTGNDIFSSGVGEGVGSGVIVSEDGYILTNSHVVNDGKTDQIKVVFADKESVPAKLVWHEPSLDLAVVKVEKTGLTPVELGDSDSIKVGDKAIAIGNPLGLDLQSTLTSGYISGLGRSITMQNGTSMDGLIQTDAAINRGNSGGALLNAKGQLIGINTAKASGGEGLGFAIPVNTAAAIVNKIKTTQNFEPVVMGIRAVNVDYYKNMKGEELNAKDGIIVIDVVPGSPADQAGIKSMDIITGIDGKEIKSMAQLKTVLLGYNLGDGARVMVQRDNSKVELDIKFTGELR